MKVDRAFLQDDGWDFVKPGRILIFALIIEFVTILGSRKLIGEIEPGSLVGRSGCWNSPVWPIV